MTCSSFRNQFEVAARVSGCGQYFRISHRLPVLNLYSTLQLQTQNHEAASAVAGARHEIKSPAPASILLWTLCTRDITRSEEALNGACVRHRCCI